MAPPPPPPLAGFFRPEEPPLGAGAAGVAYKEFDQANNVWVAVKYVPLYNMSANPSRELENHYKLVHPNIVGFRQAAVTPAHAPTHLCLVMELCEKATLIDFVLAQASRTASEAQTRCAVAQMLSAVAHAHAQGIVHRDLKLCNALLANPPVDGGMPLVKVCDLGYSRELSIGTAPRTFVGTSYYISPEVYRNRNSIAAGGRPPAYAGEPVDVWAMGVCMLILLRGDYPYSAADAESALSKGENLAATHALARLLVDEADALRNVGRISADCHRVMTSCFATEPTARPTAMALLADPWFQAGAPYPLPPCAPPPLQSLEQLRAVIGQLL